MTTPAPYAIRPALAPVRPLVVSIPHTGTLLPGDVGASLASDAMRAQPMTDWHLHQLYEFLPRLGATTIHAVYSRFVVDLNRAPNPRPLYPGRFETGLVPLQTFDGAPVFAEAPHARLIDERRRLFHAPYHDRLGALLDASIARFGRVVLIDAHSVASAANRIHGPLADDIILGDRDGAASGPWLGDALEDAFRVEGLSVSRNEPYKGGYITDHYGQRPGVDALQIEMAQRVYMDEADPAGAVATERFSAARAMLERVFNSLIAAMP